MESMIAPALWLVVTQNSLPGRIVNVKKPGHPEDEPGLLFANQRTRNDRLTFLGNSANTACLTNSKSTSNVPQSPSTSPIH